MDTHRTSQHISWTRQTRRRGHYGRARGGHERPLRPGTRWLRLMPLPDFEAGGLPPGEHSAYLADVEARYTWNAERVAMFTEWRAMRSTVNALLHWLLRPSQGGALPIGDRVPIGSWWIGGEFVTDVDHPLSLRSLLLLPVEPINALTPRKRDELAVLLAPRTDRQVLIGTAGRQLTEDLDLARERLAAATVDRLNGVRRGVVYVL